jgi:hypothetical protein
MRYGGFAWESWRWEEGTQWRDVRNQANREVLVASGRGVEANVRDDAFRLLQ